MSLIPTPDEVKSLNEHDEQNLQIAQEFIADALRKAFDADPRTKEVVISTAELSKNLVGDAEGVGLSLKVRHELAEALKTARWTLKDDPASSTMTLKPKRGRKSKAEIEAEKAREAEAEAEAETETEAVEEAEEVEAVTAE